MAMNSMRPQDHEGISSLDKDPHLLANRANENEQATIVNVEADYLPLYHAALKGDWERASSFMCCCPSAVTAKNSNVQSMTALHVAARAGKSKFVKKLVAHVNMTQEALKIQDSSGRTALHYAAMSAETVDAVDAVKAIVNKNPALTQVRDNNGWTPLLCAASWGAKEVVRYLCDITTDCPPAFPFTGPLAGRLICTVTRAGFHDIAKDLVLRYPNLATASTPDDNYSVLRVLAEMPSAFRSGSRLGFWGWLTDKCDVSVRDEMGFPRENSRDCVERPISIAFKRILFRMIKMLVPVNESKQIHDEKLSHDQAKKLAEFVCKEVSKMNSTQLVEFFKEQAILNTAASHGIEEIVLCCVECFPGLIWLTVSQQSILQVAVEHRQKRIFELLKQIGRIESETNILHVVAKLPPPFRLNGDAGPIFQMQNELRWFEDVKEIVHPSYNDERNALKQTAWEVFVEEHKELAQDAEKLAKETANYCMVVAALVTTVVFTAAFTPPGGTYSDTGIPIFLKHWAFILFVVCDVLALYFSSASMLMCLSILGSRTPVKDFSSSLPDRLATAVSSLVLATCCMIIAFGSALWIILDKSLRIISTVIAFMSLGPAVRFSSSQFALLLPFMFRALVPNFSTIEICFHNFYARASMQLKQVMIGFGIPFYARENEFAEEIA